MPVITEKQKARAIFEASEHSEEALLGSLLIYSEGESDRKAISNVATIVKPEDFVDKRRARIYQAMLSCDKAPHQINVATELVQNGTIQNGDIGYLCHLVAITPTCLDYLDYAKSVVILAEARNPNRKPAIRTIGI